MKGYCNNYDHSHWNLVAGVPAAVPTATTNPYSMTTSLCILYNAGSCHSDFVFRALLLCLISTPSLTCLVKQSLFTWVTLDLNWFSSPVCFSSMCFLMNELSPFSPLWCSLILVYRFLEVSPIYFVWLSLGHNSQMTS